MAGNESIEGESTIRKTVETFLARPNNKGRFLTVNEIATSADVASHWVTVQKVLDDMAGIGRVHFQKIGNVRAYSLNGVGKWQKQFKINETTWLFADTFLSPFGQPFIRVKETKKKGSEWIKFGEIMITPDKIGEVIDFLKEVQGGIAEYNNVKSKMMKS